jgi:hypothetical protein
MKITKKEFKKICNFLDRIEKPDFGKLDISDLFENLTIEKKSEIKRDYRGMENIKILRLLYHLESVRNKYGIILSDDKK